MEAAAALFSVINADAAVGGKKAAAAAAAAATGGAAGPVDVVNLPLAALVAAAKSLRRLGVNAVSAGNSRGAPGGEGAGMFGASTLRVTRFLTRQCDR